MDNEITWSTSLNELVYYPGTQTEELVKFGYSQTIPGCKVTCDYVTEDCKIKQFCHVQDFSSDLQQFYIRRDAISVASEHHDRIVCTSEQNQKTITNDFVVKLEINDAETALCSQSELLGRGSSSHDIDYLIGE
jgi:hypothetical protein